MELRKLAVPRGRVNEEISESRTVAASELPRIADQDEPRPVVGRRPASVRSHGGLRLSQRGAGAQALRTQHAAIEPRHQCGGGTVVHVPEADENTPGTRAQERARQAES